MSRLVCGGIPEHILGDRPPYHTTCPPLSIEAGSQIAIPTRNAKEFVEYFTGKEEEGVSPTFLPPLFLSLFFLPPPVTSSKGKRPLGPFSPPLPRSFSSCFAREGKKRETVASPPLKLFFLRVGGQFLDWSTLVRFFLSLRWGRISLEDGEELSGGT